MEKKDKDIKKKSNNIAKIRKWGIALVGVLLLIKVNKILFFLVFFYIFGFLGKYVRGQFGLKMVILDPSLFFMILVTKFFGIKILVIFLFFNIMMTDLFTNVFSPGSFLNYVIYHISPIVAVLLFGNFDMMVYGNIASLLYSILYILGRTYVLPDDPVQVWAKAITSFIFTFLYIAFFGPVFQIILTHI